jgi:hypothetical protein
MWVSAQHIERELRHVRFAKDNRSCLPKAADNHRISHCRGGVAQNGGPGGGRFTSDIKEVLDGCDLSVERTKIDPRPDATVSGLSFRPRRLGIKL